MDLRGPAKVGPVGRVREPQCRYIISCSSVGARNSSSRAALPYTGPRGPSFACQCPCLASPIGIWVSSVAGRWAELVSEIEPYAAGHSNLTYLRSTLKPNRSIFSWECLYTRVHQMIRVSTVLKNREISRDQSWIRKIRVHQAESDQFDSIHQICWFTK